MRTGNGGADEEQEITPIYIIGEAHSGTTILYRMLSMHPATTWLSQLSQRSGLIPGRLRIPFHGPIDRVLRAWTKSDWRKETGAIRRYVVPAPAEAARTWEYIIPTEEPIDKEVSVERLRLIMRSECSFWAKGFLVAKIPRLYQHMDVLLQSYPHSVFIHIVRDGRAVALSNRVQGKIRGLTDEEALRWSARRWRSVLRTMDTHAHRARVLTIRYEDLCNDVHGMLRKVVAFSGLDPEDFPFDRCPRTLTPTNGHRLRKLTLDELRILLQEQFDELERYGYMGPNKNG